MQQITLTNKEKKFIEKISMKLFLEYSFNKKTGYGSICFHHLNLTDQRLFGFRCDGSDSDTYDTAHFAIHWYEFCIKYLIKALYNFNDTKDSNRQKGITYEQLIMAFITCDKPIELLQFWYNIIIENKSPWKEIKH